MQPCSELEFTCKLIADEHDCSVLFANSEKTRRMRHHELHGPPTIVPLRFNVTKEVGITVNHGRVIDDNFEIVGNPTFVKELISQLASVEPAG